MRPHLRLPPALALFVLSVGCPATEAPPDAGPPDAGSLAVGLLRGRVVFTGSQGEVPAVGAFVQVARGSLGVTVEADGRFEIEGIPAGSASLLVTLDTDGDGGPDLAAQAETVLPADTGVDVGTILLARLASAHVRVVRGGQPVPHVRVVLEPSRERLTDDNGSATFDDLVPGPVVFVAVERVGTSWKPARGLAATLSADVLNEVSIDLATLVVGDPVPLSGSARATNGRPVRLHVADLTESANATGLFGVPSHRLPPGIYTLLADADDALPVVLSRIVVGSDESRVGALLLGSARACGSGADADHDGHADAEEPDACRCRPGFTDADDDAICDDEDPDLDGDGVDDLIDNCPAFNTNDEVDSDGDGTGDACDPDRDNDGFGNDEDNCDVVPNTNQLDLDADGVGDACDATPGVDADGDRVEDSTDNCLGIVNADQLDTDTDSTGDLCDDDDDGDTVKDGPDNCDLVANTNQLDLDADGVGDACDATPGVDVDGDRVEDSTDNCPGVANPTQVDTDHDGPGDACDPPARTPADSTACLGLFCGALKGPPSGELARLHGSANALIAVNWYGDIYRHDGTQWVFLDHPGLAERDATNRLSRDAMDVGSDFWVVGAGGLVRKFDGTTWTDLAVPPEAALSEFYRLESTGPGELFALSFDNTVLRIAGTTTTLVSDNAQELAARLGTNEAYIIERIGRLPARWDGTQFAPMAFDNLAGGLTPSALKADASGVWIYGNSVVGGRTGMFVSRWDGAAWTTTNFPARTLIDLAGGEAGEAFLLFDNGVALRWTPGGFSPVTVMPLTASGPELVHAPGPGKLLVTTVDGALAEYDGSAWTVGPQAREVHASGTVMGSDGTLWAIDRTRSSVHKFANGRWSADQPPTTGSAQALAVLPDGELWVGVYGGEVWRRPAGGAWTLLPDSGVTTSLAKLSVASASDAWVLNNSTRLSHWDGAAWTTLLAGGTVRDLKAFPGVLYAVVGDLLQRWTTADPALATIPSAGTDALNGLAATSVNDVWAVGWSGLVLHYTGGASASVVASGTTETLHSVAALPSGDVWLGGDGGLLFQSVGGDTFQPVASPLASVSPSFAFAGANDLVVIGDDVWRRTTAGGWVVHAVNGFRQERMTAGVLFSATDGYFAKGYGVGHYDGVRLRSVPTGLDSDLVHSVAARSPNDVLALEIHRASHFDGNAWTVENAVAPNIYLYALAAGLTTGEYWATSRTSVHHRSASGTWSQESSGATTTNSMYTMAVGPDGRVLVAGQHEFVSLRSVAGAWTVQAPPPCNPAFPGNEQFRAAAAIPDPTAPGFAVAGTTCFQLYLDGTWTNVPVPLTGFRIDGLHATSRTDVWLSGQDNRGTSLLWKWNGVTLERLRVPYGGPLEDFAPGPGTLLFTMGGEGTLLKLRD